MTRDEIIAKLAGRRVVASISGGKDSAAMSLHLRELGIEHDRVFMDTGWESRWTYEYLRGELTRVLGPITEIRAPKAMEDLVRHKAMFPSRQRRFCTEELKVKPMQRYIGELVAAGEDVINAVGIRAAESQARARLPEWEWSDGFDCEIWRPVIRWTEQDVVDIHHRHGLRPNPMYLLGANRVGCWPCIFARKAEIRLLSDIDPDRVDRVRSLEYNVLAGASQRHAERNTDKPFNPPTWFQASTRNAEGKRPCTPIDDVVLWARSGRHGQVELFGPADSDAGCMRWGLCETHGKDAA